VKRIPVSKIDLLKLGMSKETFKRMFFDRHFDLYEHQGKYYWAKKWVIE